MCRIKNLAILLGLCMVITACGSSEQQKSKVMLYQGDKNKKEEEQYKTTKVKKGTYEEKISATASLVYQNDKAVTIKDSNAYLDKILVKNGQKVVKGQKLATYHVKISDTKLKKKKLETEQARSEYDVNLKSKRNEVLQQERTIKTLTDATEKKLAVLQLNKLKSEYKDLQKQGKSIQKKEKDYNDLVQKRKSATLTSPYSGTVAEITDSIGDEASGENIMLIRDKKDFLLSAEDASGLRYNMTVDVGLGATLDSIKYHLKGKVISTDNLQQDLQDGNDNGGEQQNESGGAQLIRLSKKDRESYQFSKYNIYITGVSLKIEDALLVDADAVYEETENEEIKNFVYLVENGKLHKRYIVSNYKQEKTYLVNQGLEEGQTLAIVSK